jgi:hypothetical protein
MINTGNVTVKSSYIAIFIIAIGLSGCASNPDHAALGASRADVISAYGKPSADFALPNGARLQYSRQPYGRQVYNIDLDANGKVASAQQVLSEAQFAQVQPNVWKAADVECAFGKPGMVTQVGNFAGKLWVYRYDYYGTNKLLQVAIDPSGVVREVGMSEEMERRTDWTD